MSNLGRNFTFRQSPRPEDRLGRFVNTSGAAIPIGAPVVASGATDALGRRPVVIASAASAPEPAASGVIVYEEPWNAYAGYDSVLTRPSDLDSAPNGKAVQVVQGSYVRVSLTNTTASVFHGRAYAGRTMVAGLTDATPSIAIDDLLTPGAGTDSGGYWAKTADPTKAWLRVTAVNGASLDAQMLF